MLGPVSFGESAFSFTPINFESENLADNLSIIPFLSSASLTLSKWCFIRDPRSQLLLKEFYQTRTSTLTKSAQHSNRRMRNANYYVKIDDSDEAQSLCSTKTQLGFRVFRRIRRLRLVRNCAEAWHVSTTFVPLSKCTSVELNELRFERIQLILHILSLLCVFGASLRFISFPSFETHHFL